MIQGYESVAGQLAWTQYARHGTPSEGRHPRRRHDDERRQSSSDNIMFGDTPGVKYGDIRNATPKWNTIDHNLAWNSGHPIVTGINQVGPDKRRAARHRDLRYH